ncbi:T9SS type A sorting domain-containing protein [Flavobacterium salilacus subsp. salilacus]|uniref:T9SS type A sorting domain-containing protein n=1 Tax=Flavobacterium TaxID=237 RepID=UPI00107527EF|nr:MULTISPECIES: T9SS type A sorting domain-containing protein [Flavobacterium]KAF2519473.1 T9SS type A sorting domain-containing protein [Flavobacterium salilacus subsp. salilacus]MBE1614630.1 T9SS type A sorting domain-containing protein [Flavobacterium sp. SaA2.13]
MKIKLLLFFIFTSTFCSQVFSQSAGFNNTFIVFSINGSLNLYYDLNAATANYDFDGQSLGTFCEGGTGLIFKGGEHNIYKCGGCDLTSTRIYYRIYLTGNGASGNFVSNSLNYFSGFNNGCGGQDQRWEKLDYNTNLLSGLSAGNYTIEVYSDATITCGTGTVYAGNNGANYKATFTVSPTTVGGTLSGDTEFCSTVNSGALMLSGHMGNVIRWESSPVLDFSASVTQIANTTASLSLNNVTATTYYRVVVQSNECLQQYSSVHAVTINPNSWTGAIDSSWNEPLNWCGGVPAPTDAVMIGMQDNEPIINSGAAIEVESITLLSGGSLVVNSGANLTVTNAVSVASDATFTVEDNANLIQVNDVANSGVISVEKKSSPLYRLDYTLWSSPVAGQNLQEFSPNTLSNRFYDYDEATDLYDGISPAENDFVTGQGYLIRMPNNHPAYVDESTPGTVWTGTFTGIPNNGDITVPTTSSFNGYNLIGNPYPSAINIHDFFDANAGTVNETSALYFWRKRNNPEATTYALITKSAYTMNAASGGDTGSDTFTGDPSGWVINPGQGFFVQVTGSSVTFNNSMRMGVNNGQFFRMEQNEQNTSLMSRLWLNITSNEGGFKQTAVTYSNEATLGLDYGWDGKMLTNDGAIALYSVVDGVELGIQARPQFDENDVVPLAYKVTDAGSYTISLDHFDGVFEQGQNIYLKDNITGEVADLKEGNYMFTTEAGQFTNRFEIVYTTETLGIKDTVLVPDTIAVYQKDNLITIDGGTVNVKQISIYDIRGRLIYTKSDINANIVTITDLDVQQQVIVLHIITDNGLVTKKLIM